MEAEVDQLIVMSLLSVDEVGFAIEQLSVTDIPPERRERFLNASSAENWFATTPGCNDVTGLKGSARPRGQHDAGQGNRN